MITKAFEIRDRGTFIPVIATKMTPTALPPVDQTINDWHKSAEAERYLLRRAGYSADLSDYCVVLCRMEASGVDRNATYDPYAWGGGVRTYLVAHEHIIKHFDELESGAVIDVEFILKETKEPKISERLS
jgi:hypothetical protein